MVIMRQQRDQLYGKNVLYSKVTVVYNQVIYVTAGVLN